MANIFSGLFAGGDGSAANSAQQYKSQLAEYEDLMAYKQRNEDIAGQSASFDIATENMSPERKKQMKLFQMMAGGRTTGDKGMEAINKSFSQRGGTVADNISQEKNTLEANKRQQYKVDNPLPGDIGAKLEYAKAYIGEERWAEMTTEERQLEMDRAARARQLVDKGTYWEDIGTGERYSKNRIQSQVEDVVGKDIGGFLSDYETSNASSNNLIDRFELQFESLQELEDSATGWSTGIGAMLAALPATDARNYQNKLDAVNAQTVIQTMEQLKALSASGATGFGAVNLKELETMQDQWGKIDPLASNQQNLDVIKKRKKLVKEFVTGVKKRQKLEDAKYISNQDRIPKSLRSPTPYLQQKTRDDAVRKSQAEKTTTPNAVGKWNPETGKVEMY